MKKILVFILICGLFLICLSCDQAGPPAIEDDPETTENDEEDPPASNPITGLVINTAEVVMLTDTAAHVAATIVPADADDPDLTWTTDDDCITVIPHPTLEDACFINSGSEEGYARVTAVSSAKPELSEGFDIEVVKEIVLTESQPVSCTVWERGASEPNMSFYVVTGLNTSTEYSITISDITTGIDDFQVSLGLLTTEAAALSALYSDGYAENPGPLFFQGFVANDGLSTSIIFESSGDRQYFIVSDASADGDLGEFTFDIAITEYTGNKQILQTLACDGGTGTDTFFYVYNEDEEVICGAFDDAPDNGYSRVLLPSGVLPGMFWVRVAAQEYNDYGFPAVVNQADFGLTGDFAMYYNESAGSGVIGYSGVPLPLSGADTYELTNEHNQHYNNNWANYPTLVSGTPLSRKISPLEDIVVTDGYLWDEDMFKSF